MHSKPPPSSLTPKKCRRRPLYGARPRPAGCGSLCFWCLPSAPHPRLFFSCFCAQTVHSGRAHNAVKLQTFQRVILGPGGGPPTLIKGPVRAMSTNITPLSKRTLGPTAERLCYCSSQAVRSRQIANAAHNAGLSLNPTQDLKVESRPDFLRTMKNQINHLR